MPNLAFNFCIILHFGIDYATHPIVHCIICHYFSACQSNSVSFFEEHEQTIFVAFVCRLHTEASSWWLCLLTHLFAICTPVYVNLVWPILHRRYLIMISCLFIHSSEWGFSFRIGQLNPIDSLKNLQLHFPFSQL